MLSIIISLVLAVVGFVGLYYGSVLGYRYLLRKLEIEVLVHPYTNKEDRRYYLDYLRGIVFVALSLLSLFVYLRWYVQLPLFFMSGVFVTQFYLRMKRKEREEVLWECRYEQEEIDRWKKHFPKSKRSHRIVLTDAALYYRKSKKLSFTPEPLDNLVMKEIEITEKQAGGKTYHYLLLSYTLMGVPAKSYAFLVPSGKKQEVQRIVNIIMKKIKK